MENNQTEKSQAELYREERKERMTKAAKKNAKKSPQAEKIGHIVGKTIGIIIAVVLSLVVLYGCFDFFGVPQKVLTATRVGKERVTVAKYNYYYMDIYLDTYNQAYQYDSYYGSGYGAMYTGYDYKKTPMEQEYTLGTVKGYEDAETVTWADYFKANALEYVQSYVAYADLAREEGMEMTDEQKTQIEDNITSITETATQNDYSLNRYLSKLYGKGINEKLLREIYEERFLAYNYANEKQTAISDGITDEQVTEEFNTNKNDYTTFGVSLFKVSATAPELASDATEEEKTAANTAALAEAKTKADGYMAKISNNATLKTQAVSYDSTLTDSNIQYDSINYSSISNYYGAAVADWAVSADRAVGDIASIEVSDGYVIVCLNSLPAADTTKGVDVRHILVKFDTTTDEEGNTIELTAAEKTSYYAKAKSIYDEFLANPTEENFATLAGTYTDDTGSKETGGLYEDVKEGDMVEAFNDWIFDEIRKPGDTAIIESTYGYHVMYYVNNDNEEAWVDAVKTAIANEQFQAFDNETLQGDTYKADPITFVINWAAEQLEKVISKQYVNY